MAMTQAEMTMHFLGDDVRGRGDDAHPRFACLVSRYPRSTAWLMTVGVAEVLIRVWVH